MKDPHLKIIFNTVIAELSVYLDTTTFLHALFFPKLYTKLTNYDKSQRIVDQLFTCLTPAVFDWLEKHQQTDVLYSSLECLISIVSGGHVQARQHLLVKRAYSFALRIAARNGFLGIVKAILAPCGRNADLLEKAIGVSNRNGYLRIFTWRNPLVEHASQRKHLETVKYPVSAGVDIHFDNDITLRSAAKNGHLETVKFLVSTGGNVHALADMALRKAAENGHLETVKFLVSVGGDLCAFDNHALIKASKNGYLEIVKYLISMGANAHTCHDMALRFASMNGHLEIVKYLVSAGADIHACDNDAFRLACENRHWETISYLACIHGQMAKDLKSLRDPQ